MSRGSRADLPSQGGGFVDYTPPPMGWNYWERPNRFGFISDDAKKDLLRQLHHFQLDKKEHERPNRRDLKQLKRDLKRAQKAGAFLDEDLERFVTMHTLDFACHNPGAGIQDRIGYLLKEIADDPSGFLISAPKPTVLHTLTLYDLFLKHGLNVSRGSAADLNAMTDKSDAPTTPFVEFVARTIWDVPTDTPIPVNLAQNIQKIIVRRNKYEQDGWL